MDTAKYAPGSLAENNAKKQCLYKAIFFHKNICINTAIVIDPGYGRTGINLDYLAKFKNKKPDEHRRVSHYKNIQLFIDR